MYKVLFRITTLKSALTQKASKWIDLGYFTNSSNELQYNASQYDEIYVVAVPSGSGTFFGINIPTHFITTEGRFFYSGGGTATNNSFSGATFNITNSRIKLNTLYLNGTSQSLYFVYVMAR